MDDAVAFVDVDWAGRRVLLEYGWVAPQRTQRPLVVFLHEGLGSLPMWKGFPALLCDALDARGLVFSRPRNGRSTALPRSERWAPDYMHQAAASGLPAFLRAVGVDPYADPPWLLGHSDGASIGLLHAAAFPEAVAGLVLLAPHVFVEPVSLASIEAARQAFLATDLRERLARYHLAPDEAFWGWNDIWLDPAFRNWNIEVALASIRVPVLAVQGCEDEYGTLAQVHRIAAAVPATRVVVLEECRHSPHKDQPARLIEEVARFFETPGRPRTGSSEDRHTADH